MTDPAADAAKAKKEVKGLTAELKTAKSAAESFDGAVAGIVTSLDGARRAATGMVDAFLPGFGSQSLASVIEHTNKMSGFSAEMNKATGQAGNLNAALKEHRKAADGMAVGYKELTEHMTKIYIGMTDFSKMSSKAQGELAGLASKMTKLGISVEDTAANLDVMTRTLGMTWKEAKKTQMDIAKVARSLGIAPAKAAKDFAKAAPQLAQYGKQAWDVFRKLQSQAKATGIEMNDLLGITEKFDTFESAAESTAQLNAVMGTTINSVDMLRASDEQRITLLKQGISATGKSWDTMGRWEKKALALAVTQGDVNKAARLFGTTTKEMQDEAGKADPRLVATKELTKAMKEGISRGEGMAAMLEGIHSKFAKVFMPIVNTFEKFFTKTVMPKLGKALKFIDGIIKKISKSLEGMGEEGKFLKDMIGWVVAISMAMGPVLGIAGKLIPVIASLGGVISAVFSPWTLVLGGIAMAIILIKDNWEKVGASFRHFFDVSWPNFKSGFTQQWDEMWSETKAVWMGVWADIEKVFLNIATQMGVTTKKGGIDWGKMGKLAAGALQSIIRSVGELVSAWTESFGKMTEKSGGLFSSFKRFFGPGGTQLMFIKFRKMFWEFISIPITGFLHKISQDRQVKAALAWKLSGVTGNTFKEEYDALSKKGMAGHGGILDPMFYKKKLADADAELTRWHSKYSISTGMPLDDPKDFGGEQGGIEDASTVVKGKSPKKKKPTRPASIAQAAAARDREAAEAAARSVQEARFIININGERFVDQVIDPVLTQRYGASWTLGASGG